jgi:quinol-cytochrome oxidoreductase complex cytochrome b subunit
VVLEPTYLSRLIDLFYVVVFMFGVILFLFIVCLFVCIVAIDKQGYKEPEAQLWEVARFHQKRKSVHDHVV